jgi:hypothetical protein
MEPFDHDLKVPGSAFAPIFSGDKLCLIRLEEEAIHQGHILRLREWHTDDRCGYSGRECIVRVEYVEPLAHGAVLLSIITV